MGLFDRFKKKEEQTVKQDHQEEKSITLLSMAMYNNGENFNGEKLIDHLREYWGSEVSNIEVNDSTATFNVDGELVVITTISAQIPYSDILQVAPYAYNWKNAAEELKEHNSHNLIVMMSENEDDYQRHIIRTKVTASLIATSNCIGIYEGLKSILTPRDQYLDSANALLEDKVPVDLMVYIGVRASEKGNSVYTYGLTSFGKKEIEVVDSKKSLGELHGYLMNICAYVIKNDVTFKSGETLGYTQDEKIKISSSKGVFLDGETLKFDM